MLLLMPDSVHNTFIFVIIIDSLRKTSTKEVIVIRLD